jgi:hypothetical protein
MNDLAQRIGRTLTEVCKDEAHPGDSYESA